MSFEIISALDARVKAEIASVNNEILSLSAKGQSSGYFRDLHPKTVEQLQRAGYILTRKNHVGPERDDCFTVRWK